MTLCLCGEAFLSLRCYDDAMDRRGFLRRMVGGVAAAAAVRTFPFRVFSFPKEIAVAGLDLGSGRDYTVISVYKYSSECVPVSLELLQDSYFDIDNLLVDLFARRLALRLDDALIRGIPLVSKPPLGLLRQSALARHG